MNKFYTYLYRDINGTPIYVGKGCGYRAWAHINSKRNTPFTKKLQKLAREGIKLEPEFIVKDVDEELAFFVEEEAIAKYGRRDLGTGTLYNMSNGGEGPTGHRHSQETREKIRQASLNKSNNTREKLRQASLGKGHTEETKEKLRQLNAGRKLTEEQRKKISLSKKGRKLSEETCEKMRLSRTGKRHTEESRLKMKESQLKRRQKERNNIAK